MQKLARFLWFEDQAEEAANFYVSNMSMDDSGEIKNQHSEIGDQNDHPGVIAFPPLIWLIGAVLSVLSHWLLPFPMSPAVPRALGIAFAVVAPCLAAWAFMTMNTAGTNIDPAKPALTIVQNGPYRFTRNPMYLALCLLQIAVGFLLRDYVALLFVIPLVLVLHHGVILREERYLEAKFGEPYLDLKRRVRRWM